MWPLDLAHAYTTISSDFREPKQLTTATATKTSLKKWSRAPSNFNALISSRKRDARAELLFCQSKPIAVLQFLLTSPHRRRRRQRKRHF